ncbi:MAG: CAP domain-containing protein [Roseiflexaceae bacterium]
MDRFATRHPLSSILYPLSSIVSLLALAVLLAACGATSAGPPPEVLPTARILIAPTRIAAARARPSATPRPTSTAIPSPTPSPTSIITPATIGPAAPDADTALRESLLVVEINKVRAANGLPLYTHSPELSAAARAHSCDLAAHAMISHVSSDGRTLQDRLAGADPPWEWPSESIAAGTDDPAAVVAMWMDEPPEGWHRRNILDTDQREVGAGYCYTPDDPSGNHHYWTADFSRRASP